MIRLRCPHHGCPIDVADDMLGARIRCPHCGELLFVLAQYQESADPPAEPRSEAVHAGMPPLAAMLGIREGRGHAWGSAAPARANMTDIDWQSLAAFEQVLYAVAALKTAIGFGVAAALLTGLLWIGSAQTSAWEAEFTSGRLLSRLASLLVLTIAFTLMAIGQHRLARVRFGVLISLAALSTLAVALVLAANALLILYPLADAGYRGGVGPAVLAIPLQVVAAFFACRTLVLVQRAHRQASPHAIRHRLIAALEYLDWLEREQYGLSVPAHLRRRTP